MNNVVIREWDVCRVNIDRIKINKYWEKYQKLYGVNQPRHFRSRSMRPDVKWEKVVRVINNFS